MSTHVPSTGKWLVSLWIFSSIPHWFWRHRGSIELIVAAVPKEEVARDLAGGHLGWLILAAGHLPGLVNVYKKRTGKSPCFMGNSLCLWPFPIAFCMFTRPGNGKTRLLGRGTRFPIKAMDL